MKKVFRALTAEVCEKMWIGDNEPVPEGYHENAADATRAFAAQRVDAGDAVEAPRRGRPPKSAE